MKKTSKTKSVDKQISRFLNQNPNLKEALDIFNISVKNYKKAIKATTRKPMITTFNTTNSN